MASVRCSDFSVLLLRDSGRVPRVVEDGGSFARDVERCLVVDAPTVVAARRLRAGTLSVVAQKQASFAYSSSTSLQKC